MIYLFSKIISAAAAPEHYRTNRPCFHFYIIAVNLVKAY